MKQRPTIERLHELLRYDEATGKLYWRETRNGKALEGDEVGSPHCRGYLETQIDDVRLLVHVVIFAMIHNRWPTGIVDHEDRIRTHNRKHNLREVTTSESTRNSVRVNATGFRGVYEKKHKTGTKYHSQLMVGKKRLFLGSHNTAEQAARAYDKAVLENFGPTFPTNANLGLLG